MKKKFFRLALLILVLVSVSVVVSCNSENSENSGNSANNANNETEQLSSKVSVQDLTSDMFVQNIFDYRTQKEWKYKGNLPCVIDFYADWCGPCKMVAPIMDELADEYHGKINFYKVNVDNEQELASVFGVQSIPSILFIPATGQPQMTTGANNKDGYRNIINQVFQIN